MSTATATRTLRRFDPSEFVYGTWGYFGACYYGGHADAEFTLVTDSCRKGHQVVTLRPLCAEHAKDHR